MADSKLSTQTSNNLKISEYEVAIVIILVKMYLPGVFFHYEFDMRSEMRCAVEYLTFTNDNNIYIIKYRKFCNEIELLN